MREQDAAVEAEGQVYGASTASLPTICMSGVEAASRNSMTASTVVTCSGQTTSNVPLNSESVVPFRNVCEIGAAWADTLCVTNAIQAIPRIRGRIKRYD